MSDPEILEDLYDVVRNFRRQARVGAAFDRLVVPGASPRYAFRKCPVQFPLIHVA
jgi:hypothetical protein